MSPIFLIIALLQVVYVQCQHNVKDFGQVNAALHYDRNLLESAVVQKPQFIMFYAPWCGHCQRLSGTFDMLAMKYNKELNGDRVVIGKVDCTKHTALCSDYNVLGYPTLLFFWSRTVFSSKYKGSRDLSSLDKFVEGLIASGPPSPGDSILQPSPVRPTAKTGLFELTDTTFDDQIATGQHFVNFYAPWCSHCQTLAPIWKLFASRFENDHEITISKVDCTKYNSVCAKNAIRGFPTLIYFNKGLKMESYEGVRDLNNLVEFVSLMKSRAAGSSTLEEAKDDEKPAEAIELQDDEPAEGIEAQDVYKVLFEHQQLTPDAAEKVHSAVEETITLLTVETFPHVVGTVNQIHVVLFHVPWCPHCQALEPTWTEAAQKAKGEQVTFSQVNCVEQSSLCVSHRVPGYPTITTFQNGRMVNTYSGPRTIESLLSYVEDMKKLWLTQSKVAGKPAFVDLTLDSFAAVVSSQTYTFVSFTVPWNDQSEVLRVVTEKLGQIYINEDWITIARVDCSSEDVLCRQSGIDQYPSLILYHNNDRIAEYTGTKDLESLHRFVDYNRRRHDEL